MFKFKVGDKVKIIKQSNCRWRSSCCCNKYIRKIGVISQREIRDENNVYGVRFPQFDEWCSAFSEDCLELTSPKEIKRFGIVKFLETYCKT